MKNALKAEFRKLYTIRSTYLLCAFSLLILVFFAFYVEGLKAADIGANNAKLANAVINAVNNLSIFAALVGLLLVTHEYRYNTIMYTLTAANSRTKVFFAKIIAISTFTLLFTLVVGILSPLLILLAANIRGLDLIAQFYSVGDLLWRSLFIGWGLAMTAFVFAMLLRSQVVAIVVLLIAPTTIEQLLSLLLKDNTIYLPFRSITNITFPAEVSAGKSALVFLAYLVPSLIITWLLFLRRDAN